MGARTIKDLSVLWRFWQNTKWYLVTLLIFVVVLSLYQKNISTVNFVVVIVFAILFLMVIMIFNDNQGLMGDSVFFAVNPLPPHLGLDGISNDVRNSN